MSGHHVWEEWTRKKRDGVADPQNKQQESFFVQSVRVLNKYGAGTPHTYRFPKWRATRHDRWCVLLTRSVQGEVWSIQLSSTFPVEKTLDCLHLLPQQSGTVQHWTRRCDLGEGGIISHCLRWMHRIQKRQDTWQKFKMDQRFPGKGEEKGEGEEKPPFNSRDETRLAAVWRTPFRNVFALSTDWSRGSALI